MSTRGVNGGRPRTGSRQAHSNVQASKPDPETRSRKHDRTHARPDSLNRAIDLPQLVRRLLLQLYHLLRVVVCGVVCVCRKGVGRVCGLACVWATHKQSNGATRAERLVWRRVWPFGGASKYTVGDAPKHACHATRSAEERAAHRPPSSTQGHSARLRTHFNIPVARISFNAVMASCGCASATARARSYVSWAPTTTGSSAGASFISTSIVKPLVFSRIACEFPNRFMKPISHP